MAPISKAKLEYAQELYSLVSPGFIDQVVLSGREKELALSAIPRVKLVATKPGRFFFNGKFARKDKPGHVQSLMRRHCKCHGMSGSCTMKTCWMRLPHFREVGNSIKDRFDGATRVLVSNAGSLRDIGRSGRSRYKFQLKPYNPDHKPPNKKDLVFYEDSPQFCDRDRRFGLSGTSGRACNMSSLGIDGCDLMCCGRGYTIAVKQVVERCKCTFQWCCHVECKNCTVTRTLYTCK